MTYGESRAGIVHIVRPGLRGLCGVRVARVSQGSPSEICWACAFWQRRLSDRRGTYGAAVSMVPRAEIDIERSMDMSKFWENIGNDKLRNAKSTEGGLYLSPGNYLLEIQRCKMIKTQHNDEAFVAEFKVITSDNPSIKPGDEPGYFVNMDGKFPALSLGNVVDFMRAGMASAAKAAGEEHPPVESIEIDTETASSITGADNILAGVKIHAYAFNKPTKEGKDYTRIKWRPYAA